MLGVNPSFASCSQKPFLRSSLQKVGLAVPMYANERYLRSMKYRAAVRPSSACSLMNVTTLRGMFGSGRESVGSMKTDGIPVAMKSLRSRSFRM